MKKSFRVLFYVFCLIFLIAFVAIITSTGIYVNNDKIYICDHSGTTTNQYVLFRIGDTIPDDYYLKESGQIFSAYIVGNSHCEVILIGN